MQRHLKDSGLTLAAEDGVPRARRRPRQTLRWHAPEHQLMGRPRLAAFGPTKSALHWSIRGRWFPAGCGARGARCILMLHADLASKLAQLAAARS
jgi:hypothetical protein